MKKISIIFSLAILILIGWLVWPRPQTVSKPIAPTSTHPTNVSAGSAVSSSLTIPPNTNAFVRPDLVDEETWHKWLVYRDVVLNENQPIEFYARVVDEIGKPVADAKLALLLSRFDESIFTMTNFPHWDPEKAQQDKHLELFSDANGWIRLKDITGKTLRIESLVKEGYSWTMPQIDSFTYEYTGKRTVGYAGMEDAFDPAKGYILHLQKIEDK